MGQRRIVRAEESFYQRLEVELPEVRTGGVPSRFDFLSYELPPIVDLLAQDYESVTQERPGDDQRVFIRSGTLLYSVAVWCRLVEDEVVLTWLAVEPIA